jgi:hypothetical protein
VLDALYALSPPTTAERAVLALPSTPAMGVDGRAAR